MADKLDSPDGQTHDEDELTRRIKGDVKHLDDYLSVITPGEWTEQLWQTAKWLKARLDAAERERDALKAKLAVKQTDRECANKIFDKCHRGPEYGKGCDCPECWTTRNTIIRAHVAARVAEAVRPWREALPDPDKLRILADWFDLYDDKHRSDFCKSGSREVQEDLRHWAQKIRKLLEADRD